jgi:nucleoside-triphosphatase THEP1
MANSPLLPIFQKAYHNTDLTPLVQPEQLKALWVEYGREALEALVQLVEDHAAQDAKIIFSGHRGCGKSTLLAQFGREVGDRYFVTFFSISDLIEMSDVNHINILFAIAVNLMLEAESQQIKIPQGIQDSLHKWFAKRTRVETERPIGAELSVGFDLFKLISGKLKTEATIRDEIKQEFERNVSDLVAKLNEIAATIQAASSKNVLVIIDDLDKLDLAVLRPIFQDHIKTLFQPGFCIIFEMPIAFLRDRYLSRILKTETQDKVLTIPTLKLFRKGEKRGTNTQYQKDIMQMLLEILNKRLSSEILEPETARLMAIKSGGMPRELIRIANHCCRICLREIRRNPEKVDIKINQSVLNEAIKNLRLDFEICLGKNDYNILVEVYQNFSPLDREDNQSFLDLLHSLHILEYQNDDVWYDVHPIVEDLLRRKGLVL